MLVSPTGVGNRERLTGNGRTERPEWIPPPPRSLRGSSTVELAAVAVAVFVASGLQSYLVFRGTLPGLRLFHRRTGVVRVRR